VIAGVTDAVTRAPAGYVGTRGDDFPGGAIARSEREFPIWQVGVSEPLVCTAVDGEFRAGADSAELGADQNLTGTGFGHIHVANGNLEGLDNDGLARVHDFASMSVAEQLAVYEPTIVVALS
jgi:hypothetical protein